MSIIFFDILKEPSETYWMFREYYLGQLLFYSGLPLLFGCTRVVCVNVANGIVLDISPLPLLYEKENYISRANYGTECSIYM